MRVGILGPLEVTAGGRAVQVRGTRLRGLLIRLALDSGRTVPVESLAEALWPEDGPGRPVHAVQSLASRLRAILPDDVHLRGGESGYRLELPPDAVDAHRFERLTLEGWRALREGEPGAAASRLREGLALWTRSSVISGWPRPTRRCC